MSIIHTTSYWGKYRSIILAVICFLVIDLTVLSLNFYISFQVEQSATAINLAGRQRMLSQRMTKELLNVQIDQLEKHDSTIQTTLEGLKKTTDLFNTTLTAFKQGGIATGSDGQPVQLDAITSHKGKDILGQADNIWLPLHSLLTKTTEPPLSAETLAYTVSYAIENNNELLNLMNQLTSLLDQEANHRADVLRWIQTIGIVLALLNFAYIIGSSLNRLLSSDRQVIKAQEETKEILNTVKEGLFLLDHQFVIGSQYSASLEKIIGQKIESGSQFKPILHAMVSPEIYKSACDFITLLLGNRVKESLVQDLNPLQNIEILPQQTDNEGNQTLLVKAEPRYLTLQFNRSLQHGLVSHLLVTVFDVTAQVKLEKALAEARKKAKAEVEVMLDLLKIHPSILSDYLNHTEVTLLKINELLRNMVSEKDYRMTLSHIFREIHRVKGEAATIGLTAFEDKAHVFESMLANLRHKGTVSGHDLLVLPFPLEEFLGLITTSRQVATQLASFQSNFNAIEEEGQFMPSLTTLAQRIALDQGKQVRLTSELELLDTLPMQTKNKIKDIALQLVRNAVVHGIELPAVREARQKPVIGDLYLSFKKIGDEYELILRDDGTGINAQHIRTALLSQGLYSESYLNEMSDHQIIDKIFDSGFSTVSDISKDAGYGVGMDIVKHKIKLLGARLRISTRERQFTQFSIRFTVDENIRSHTKGGFTKV